MTGIDWPTYVSEALRDYAKVIDKASFLLSEKWSPESLCAWADEIDAQQGYAVTATRRTCEMCGEQMTEAFGGVNG